MPKKYPRDPNPLQQTYTFAGNYSEMQRDFVNPFAFDEETVRKRNEFRKQEGCYPEVKEYRDSLIAEGWAVNTANHFSLNEWARLNGLIIKPDPDPYLDLIPRRVKSIRTPKLVKRIKRPKTAK